MHVAAGHYDGYAVSLDRESPTNVCVRGTGTTHLDLEARLPGLERWQQPLGRWREEVRAALYELRSVAGTDYGVACTEGRGVQVFLTDWREVDAAVRAIGELLRARDLDMEVLITVSGGGVDVRRASLPAEPALASEPVRSPVPS